MKLPAAAKKNGCVVTSGRGKNGCKNGAYCGLKDGPVFPPPLVPPGGGGVPGLDM